MKKSTLLAIICILFYANHAVAQKQPFEWVETTLLPFTSPKMSGYSMEVANSGRSYVFGYNTIATSSTPSGYMLLAGFNNLGMNDWHVKFPATIVYSAEMHKDSQGNLIVVTSQAGGIINGDTLGGWTASGAATMSPAIAVIKFDTLGNVLWKNHFQIFNSNAQPRFIVKANDDIVISGEGSVIWNVNSTLTNISQDFMMSIDGTSGSITSLKTAPYTNSSSFIADNRKIFPLSNGNILTINRIKDSFQPVKIKIIEFDIVSDVIVSTQFITINPQITGTSYKDLADYQYDENNNNLYLFGSTDDNGIIIETDTIKGNSGGNIESIFVARYDMSTQKILNSLTYKSSTQAFLDNTSFDGNNQLTFTIQYKDSITNNNLDSSYYPVTNSNGNQYNVLLNNVDTNLSLNYWNYSVDDGGSFQSNRTQVYGPNETLFLLYSGGNNLYFDGQSIFAQSRTVIAKIGNSSTSVDVQKNKSTGGITLYPNPSHGQISLSNDKDIISIEVYNLLGKQVLNKSINNKNTKINLAHLPKGMYVVNIRSNEGSLSKKIIIE